MTTVYETESGKSLETGQWITIGVAAAVAAVVAVLLVMAIMLAIWPDLALFRPLDSYSRAAVFTAVPALIATAVFAWLAANREDPVASFKKLALIVLLLSFIPDYILPVPNRTLITSSATAFLHVVAAAVIVFVLIAGYRRFSTS